MPAENVTKVVFSGSGLGETFAWGFCVSPANWASNAELQDAVNDYVTEVVTSTYWSEILQLLAADQHYDAVTAYHYPVYGAPAAFSAQGSINSPHAAGSGASPLGLQNACVVSFRTPHSGASYRGRAYLPATGCGPLTGHTFDNTVIDNVAEGMAHITNLFVEAAVSAGHTDANLVVASVAKGVATPVTLLSVDNKPDTQRRREESFAATHTAHQTVVPSS